MSYAVTVGLLLALSPGAAAAEEKTLWLIDTLYPGQEAMVPRTEEALGKMLSVISDEQIIGSKALAGFLSGKKLGLAQLRGDSSRGDPVDGFVSSLGFARVVLLKGGQDDQGYHFRLTSYIPAKSEATSADGAGNGLEKALLAAMIKLVPLASTLEVVSQPQGATVYVDGEKVGVTPYTGQILPGERRVRIDAQGHRPIEKKLDVLVRGNVRISDGLEKVPALLVVLVQPPGTSIFLDGKKVGADKFETSIQPGSHRIHLEKEGYKPLDESIDIPSDKTFAFERTLAQTGWESFKKTLAAAQDEIYARPMYVSLSYESDTWNGDNIKLQHDPTVRFGSGVWAPQKLSDATLHGVNLEFGGNGKYFGLVALGLTALFSDDLSFILQNTTDGGQLGSGVYYGEGRARAFVLRTLQPQLRYAVWRFTLGVQGGFAFRLTDLAPTLGAGGGDLWGMDFAFSLKGILRFYIISGLFVEGGYRHDWTLFKTRDAFSGLNVGIGYAY